MPSIYDLKQRFQRLLRPIVSALAAARVTANQVTIVAMLLSIAMGTCMALFAQHLWILALLPIIMLVRMALNAIDGMLAREHKMQSALGGFLNELGDVVSDIALYLPFALLVGISSHLVIAVVLLALISEFTGVAAVMVGASRRYDGPMGKSDRAVVFGALGLFIGTGVVAISWANYILVILAILLIVTIVNRIKQALKECHAST